MNACIPHAGDDIRKLENGVHCVSGTPGRVFDMIKRKVLRTRHIKTLVLDEADEMLAKNFKDQIYDIYRYLPPETQVGLLYLMYCHFKDSASSLSPPCILLLIAIFTEDHARVRKSRDPKAERQHSASLCSP